MKVTQNRGRNDPFLQAMGASARGSKHSVAQPKAKSPPADKKTKPGFISGLVGIFKPSKNKKRPAEAQPAQHRLSGDEEIKEAQPTDAKAKPLQEW